MRMGWVASAAHLTEHFVERNRSIGDTEDDDYQGATHVGDLICGERAPQSQLSRVTYLPVLLIQSFFGL